VRIPHAIQSYPLTWEKNLFFEALRELQGLHITAVDNDHNGEWCSRVNFHHLVEKAE